MKINPKFYDLINKEPKSVQETKFGKIEIHSLNDYPYLYNMYISKRNFTYWSNKGGSDYKLLIEDSFYEVMKDLYSKRVNENWLEFYEKIEKNRKKTLFAQYLPITLVSLVIMIVVSMLLSGTQFYLLGSGAVVVAFFFITRVLSKNNNSVFDSLRNEAVEKIKLIVGVEHFDKLLDDQDSFIKKFYDDQRAQMGIENEETSESTEDEGNKDE